MTQNATTLCKQCNANPVYADLKICAKCYADKLLTPIKKERIYTETWSNKKLKANEKD